jgi:3-polyprenyl-4-hydroxybenzoate decarboxylase
MHRNLRTFLELLSREKDLVTIDAEVDPILNLLKFIAA